MLDAGFVENVNPDANSSFHSNALFTMKNAPRANVATSDPCSPRYDPCRANISAKTIVSPLVSKMIVLNPPKKMLWTEPGWGQANPLSGLFIRRNTKAPKSVPKNAISPKMKIHIPRETFSRRSNGHFSPMASMTSRPRSDSWPQPTKAAVRIPVPRRSAGRPIRSPQSAIPAPAATTMGQRLQCSSPDSAPYEPFACPPSAMATGRYVTPVAETTGTPSGKLNYGGGEGTPHSS